MHSFKFLPCKVGSLLTKITDLLVNSLALFIKKKKSFSRFQFFPDFALSPDKSDTLGKRERPLTFQNMVQEMLSNDASRAKSVRRKISFFTSKKSV